VTVAKEDQEKSIQERIAEEDLICKRALMRSSTGGERSISAVESIAALAGTVQGTESGTGGRGRLERVQVFREARGKLVQGLVEDGRKPPR
jgi:hypothetical protein